MFTFHGIVCNLWNWHPTDLGIRIFIKVQKRFFVCGSLISIAIIALERVQATFFPFNNRVLKKWVYLLMIAAVWVTSGRVGNYSF